MLYYCLVKITPKKKTIAALMMMMCVPVVGLRVPSSCPVVLRGRLIALAHLASSFALALVYAQFQSVPLLPRPNSLYTWPAASIVKDTLPPLLVSRHYNFS